MPMNYIADSRGRGRGDAPAVHAVDNRLDVAVRFVVPEHGIREMKDRFTRCVLAEFDRAGIETASATFEITGVSPLRVEIPPR